MFHFDTLFQLAALLPLSPLGCVNITSLSVLGTTHDLLPDPYTYCSAAYPSHPNLTHWLVGQDKAWIVLAARLPRLRKLELRREHVANNARELVLLRRAHPALKEICVVDIAPVFVNWPLNMKFEDWRKRNMWGDGRRDEALFVKVSRTLPKDYEIKDVEKMLKGWLDWIYGISIAVKELLDKGKRSEQRSDSLRCIGGDEVEGVSKVRLRPFKKKAEEEVFILGLPPLTATDSAIPSIEAMNDLELARYMLRN